MAIICSPSTGGKALVWESHDFVNIAIAAVPEEVLGYGAKLPTELAARLGAQTLLPRRDFHFSHARPFERPSTH